MRRSMDSIVWQVFLVALATDLERVAQLGVRASPTLDFNEGRQRLTGNVGYRILEANIQELLRTPAGQQSWC